MRAAVTREPNVMEMADVPDAREPGSRRGARADEAVGLCGSDYHFLTGEIVTTTVHGPQFPKIQGHEVSAVIEQLGPDAPSHLEEGQRVAIWPLRGCGECYACSIGRSNICPNFSPHRHPRRRCARRAASRCPSSSCSPSATSSRRIAAFVEPISIAVHAVNRGRVAEGEHVVVLGAGPIGQALSIAARERGAKVLLVDLVASRLELGRLTGADVLDASGGDDVVAEAPRVVGRRGTAGRLRRRRSSPRSSSRRVELVVVGGPRRASSASPTTTSSCRSGRSPPRRSTSWARPSATRTRSPRRPRSWAATPT